jgi:large conductance mechanosensitive channel
MRGFKNFLMRGDVIVVAVGLVVALAFSMLVTSFTTNIINPIVAAAGGTTGTAWAFMSAITGPRRSWISAPS